MELKKIYWIILVLPQVKKSWQSYFKTCENHKNFQDALTENKSYFRDKLSYCSATYPVDLAFPVWQQVCDPGCPKYVWMT